MKDNEKCLKIGKRFSTDEESVHVKSLVKTLKSAQKTASMWQKKSERLQEELNKLENNCCNIFEAWERQNQRLVQDKMFFQNPIVHPHMDELEIAEQLKASRELVLVRHQLAQMNDKEDQHSIVGLSFIEDKLTSVLGCCRHIRPENRSLTVLVSAASVLTSVYILRKLF